MCWSRSSGSCRIGASRRRFPERGHEPPAPADSGILITNPPYGVRLSEQQELAEFYPRLGDALKKKFSGWTAYILTADLRLAKLIGLAASKRTPLFNGALECRLFEFKLVAGSMRKPRSADVPGAVQR